MQGAAGAMLGGASLRNTTGHVCTLREIPHPDVGGARRGRDPGRLARDGNGVWGQPPWPHYPLVSLRPGGRTVVNFAGETTAAGHASERFGSHGMAAPSPSRPQKPAASVRSPVRPVVAVPRPVPTRPAGGAATAGATAASRRHHRAGRRQTRSAHLLPADARQRLHAHRRPAALPSLLAGPQHGRPQGDEGATRARPQLRADTDDRARRARHLRHGVDRPGERTVRSGRARVDVRAHRHRRRR